MAQEMEQWSEGPDSAVPSSAGSAPALPDAAALDAIQANALSQLSAIDAGVQALEAYRWTVLASLGHLAVERAGTTSSDAIAMSMRAVAAEIGVQSRVSDRTVEARIGEAMGLVDTWPALVEAFGAGRIGLRHVRVIADAGGVLDTTDVTAEQRALSEAEMVALAETTTPARVAKAARRAADALVAEPLTARHRAARETRRVRCSDGDDGMSWIGAYMPTVMAKGAQHRLLAGARAKAKDDPRTIDQWMADAFCELLLTGTGAPTIEATSAGSSIERSGPLGAITPVVQVTFPITTVIGADQASGVLDGHAPVDADTARTLAALAPTWQRLLTDPVTGTVVEVDTYTPTAAPRRLLQARDQHCRFPGCGGVARTDDLDHTIAWEDGGPTALDNLAHLCRRHHTLKHATAWLVSQPAPGVLHWTSPLGETYVDTPPRAGPTFDEPPPDDPSRPWLTWDSQVDTSCAPSCIVRRPGSQQHAVARSACRRAH